MSTYPRNFSHIGISVPDVEKAAEFYSDVMGWYHIMEPTVIEEETETPIGQMCIDVFGSGWGSFKIAHMSTGDKIGVEMFEFQNNESPEGFEDWKTSTFHFCVQDPDIEGLVEKNSGSWGQTTDAHTRVLPRRETIQNVLRGRPLWSYLRGLFAQL